MTLEPMPLSPAPTIAAFEETWYASREFPQCAGVPEVRIVLGRRPDAWFLVSLIGPSRKTASAAWAVNKRAFSVVLEYLKTPELRAPAG
jgi:hypothetical protein